MANYFLNPTTGKTQKFDSAFDRKAVENSGFSEISQSQYDKTVGKPPTPLPSVSINPTLTPQPATTPPVSPAISNPSPENINNSNAGIPMWLKKADGSYETYLAPTEKVKNRMIGNQPEWTTIAPTDLPQQKENTDPYQEAMMKKLDEMGKAQQSYYDTISKQKSSQDIYDQYRNKLGIPEKEAQIQTISDQLTNLEKNISERSFGQGENITSALKSRIYAGESNPLIKNLSSLQQGIKPLYDQLASGTKFASEDQARQAELAKMPLDFQSKLLPLYQDMLQYKTPEQQLASKIAEAKALQGIKQTEISAGSSIYDQATGKFITAPSKTLSPQELDLQMVKEGFRTINPADTNKVVDRGEEVRVISGRTYAKAPAKTKVGGGGTKTTTIPETKLNKEEVEFQKVLNTQRDVLAKNGSNSWGVAWDTIKGRYPDIDPQVLDQLLNKEKYYPR